MKQLSRQAIAKLGLIFVASVMVALQLAKFPYPSPVIEPFLEPKKRWPEEQIKEWVENGNPDKSFVEFFQRDPERYPPGGNNLVAPADGVVKGIIHTETLSYFVVGLSFWDVHVVRTPVAGEVVDIEEQGLAVFRDASETENQAYLMGKAGPVQQIVTIRTDQGDYKVRLITSWWASRLKVSARIGSKVEKGDRIGRILLGSSVVIDTPAPMTFAVEPRTRIVAGETIIWEGAN